MKKKAFETPQIDVLRLQQTDVIANWLSDTGAGGGVETPDDEW